MKCLILYGIIELWVHTVMYIPEMKRKDKFTYVEKLHFLFFSRTRHQERWYFLKYPK